MKRPIVISLALAGWFALISGCGRTTEVRFYSLRPLAPALDVAPSPLRAAPVRTVSLAPVKLAGYLRRPQLVRRTAPYQLTYLEFDRWAGPPEEEIGEALNDALATELGSSWRVVLNTGTSSPAAVPLEVEVLQMELNANGQACIKARWTCAGATHEAAIAHAGGPAEGQRANLVELAHRMAWDVKLVQ